ncbi:MAG: aspartate kinase [Clostridiales bacterium]|nr:aspartate kinase [Candidatus Equinaster intestinalis]
MLKVLKFGGSSLSDAAQFKKVADIIKAEKERKYIVASAPGKRFDNDTKVTDMLLDCFDKSYETEYTEKCFAQITERFNNIIEGLGLNFSLEEDFNYIKSSLKHHAGRDYFASRGEYLNAKILAEYLGYPFIDASVCIFFNEDGTLNSEKTNNILGEILEKYEYAVLPGFYGSMPNGTIKTFSRGGSDITGSIVARAAKADVYENWTDVSGLLMVDPRIVENPKTVKEITYRELRELSYMGATVLHEEAIFPVKKAGIPINIRNTNAPADKGTFIVPKATTESSENVITGVAGLAGFTAIFIEKAMMNAEVGFTRRVLETLENHNLCFEHLPSGIDTMSIVLRSDAIKELKGVITADIVKKVEPDSITLFENLALIAVVGRGMISNRGTAAKVFTALADANINIRMIDQGSSELNIIIGVEEKDLKDAIRVIYNKFVG